MNDKIDRDELMGQLTKFRNDAVEQLIRREEPEARGRIKALDDLKRWLATEHKEPPPTDPVNY